MTDYYSLLQLKIDAIRDDPNQSRRLVYDLARYALKNKAFARDPTLTAVQIEKQLRALEVAIALVEANAQNDDVRTRRGSRLNDKQEESAATPATSTDTDFEVVRQPPRHRSSRRDLLVLPPKDVSPYERAAELSDTYYSIPNNRAPAITPEVAALIQLLADERKSVTRRAVSWFDGLFRFVIVGAIGFGAYAVWSGGVPDLARLISPSPPFAAAPATESVVVPPVPFLPSQSSQESTAALPPETPLPKVYGVYAIYSDRLINLEAVPTDPVDPRKPNLRQIVTPSRSVFPDGRISFTVYQRDLANSAPITVPVRFASTIASTMRFGPGGTLVTVPPEVDTWLIHTAGFDFRVLPVSNNKEMILIRPDNPDFVLPAGRYVLLLNGQPYDFSVAGKVADPRTCVEGTMTNRGPVFYECKTAEGR
jgi:hypothetical protein